MYTHILPASPVLSSVVVVQEEGRRLGISAVVDEKFSRLAAGNLPRPKKVRSEPGSERFSPILNILNTEPDLRFGSAISLNSGPNLGPVQRGSGSTLGSEPDHGITNYTGLQTEDFLAPDYGSDMYAMRIALIQLHTQIERLKALRAPLVVQVKFPDMETVNIPEEIRQYGIETGLVVTAQQLEQYWCQLKARRQVSPLPFITPTRRD
jgi:hypothetical protein